MAAVLAALAGGGVGVAHAQGPVAAGPRAPEGQTLEQYAANAVLRLALLDLRSLEERSPSDFAVTSGLLRVAQGFAPRSADIARRRTEAAYLSGDEDELLAATEQVVRLDPTDSVSLLRVLTRRIAKMQTSEERLAAYDRAVASDRLDAAVRSRMALDAALLLKERGDEAGYVARLKQACQLDSTNKDAALLAFTYYSERSADPMGRLELLGNLLMADPLDARVLGQVRDELASAGAFKGADRMHQVAAGVYRAAGVRDTLPLEVTALVLHWRNNGARGTLDSINQSLEEQRQNVDRLSRQQGGAFIQRPEDVRIAEPFEEVRLASALALGRGADVLASVNDMTRTLSARLEVLRDRMRRPEGVTEEQAQGMIRETAQRQVLWQCLAVAMMPPADASLAEQVVRTPVSPDAASPLVEAWVGLRDGRLEKVAEGLDAAGDSLWTDLGRAVLAEKTVSDGEAARAFRAVGKRAPLTALGAMSADIEHAMAVKDGGGRPSEEDPARFEAWAKTIPAWVDTMAARPHGFQAVRAEPVTLRASATEPVGVRVRVRNLCQVPLGLGAGRTINTRLLFLPSIIGNRNIPANMLDPEVIEVDRRLRLMPNEEMECIVSPEVGIVGYALEQTSYFPSRVRWRVVQGFEASAGGAVRPGLGCVESQIDPGVLHEAVPEVRLGSAELERRMSAAGEARLPELLVAARIKLLLGQDAGNDRLIDAIVRRFPGWSVEAKVTALASLPSSRLVRGMAGLDAAAARESDVRVLSVAAVTRSQGPNDPILTAAEATGDAVLVKLVAGVRERYARNLPPADPGARVKPEVPEAAPAAPAPAVEPSK